MSARVPIGYLVDDDEVTRSDFDAVLSTGKCDVVPRRVGIATSRRGASTRRWCAVILVSSPRSSEHGDRCAILYLFDQRQAASQQRNLG
jgi:hypothetical protein